MADMGFSIALHVTEYVLKSQMQCDRTTHPLCSMVTSAAKLSLLRWPNSPFGSLSSKNTMTNSVATVHLCSILCSRIKESQTLPGVQIKLYVFLICYLAMQTAYYVDCIFLH